MKLSFPALENVVSLLEMSVAALSPWFRDKRSLHSLPHLGKPPIKIAALRKQPGTRFTGKARYHGAENARPTPTWGIWLLIFIGMTKQYSIYLK